MLFGRKKPGYAAEAEMIDNQEQPEKKELLEYLESLPEVDDEDLGDMDMTEQTAEPIELTEAQHLAEYIRLRTSGRQLTRFSQLQSEVENLDKLMEEWETDESCQDIIFVEGNKDKFYYSNQHMSDNYALIAALVEEQDLPRTIATMVRFNCKTYPAPTPYTYFERTPYSVSKAQLDRAVAVIEGSEEYQDIMSLKNNLGESFFYSTEHMSGRYAKALADVDEYAD